jgi:DNA adenine methylase
MEKTIQSGYNCRPPLAGWLGGKSLQAKRIVERIPKHQCYCEPFAGGAWILFRKPESKAEILNDINRDVANLYRVIRHHWEEFVNCFRWTLISREDFEVFRRSDPDTLTDIQRAVRFYFLHHAGFNGRAVSPTFRTAVSNRPKLNLLRLKAQIEEAHQRLRRVYLECRPYAEVITLYDRPDTFFYVDPPYYGCEAYYGRGFFGRDDFALLAAQLREIKGRCIISLNDVPEIRKIFSGFRLEEITTYYLAGSNRKPATELLFFNW